MHHYHYEAAAYFMFVLGWAVHMWGKASLAVQSKLNGINSLSEYMTKYGNIIAGRFVLAACFFGVLIEYDYIMPFVGGFFTPAAAFFAKHPGPLPLVWPITGLLGWLMDSLIDTAFAFGSRWWPGLNQEIPPEPTVVGTVTQTTVFKGTVTDTAQSPTK